MTDLRGVLPGRRPPIDATVLDEPTSEVPIIKPAGDVDAEPAAADPEPVPETEPAAEAEPAAAAEELEELVEAEPVAETEAAVEADLAADLETAAPEAETAPEPVVTPPVVPAFGSVTSAAGEMAKMAWSPAPPPGLVPAPAASVFEPPPPVTEPEPVEAEIVEPVAEPEPVAEVEPEPEPVAEVEPEPAAVVDPAPALAHRAPGDVAGTPISLWSDQATGQLRDDWRELQVQFVDDPNAAVTGAKGLVTEAVRQLADTLLAAQAELDPFRGTDRVDTEAMRVAMRRYREFLDRVLAL
jgi:hypothetical protein